LLILDEVELVLLEAFFSQGLIGRAKSVAISAPMIILHLPCDFPFTADFPHRWRHAIVQWLQERAMHTMMCILGCGVDACFANLRFPRRTSCEATCISHWCLARCTPWIVLVNVFWRAWSGLAIDCPKLWINCARLAQTAKINLPAPTQMIALWATNEAALAVPEGCLTVVAGPSGNICALTVS
jgi:hypothetical protein